MSRNKLITLLILLFQSLFALGQTKIIDMHVHSYTDGDFGEREPAADYYGNKGSSNATIHRQATFEAFKKWNIVKAAVSGNPQSVEEWVKEDKDNRVIKGAEFFLPTDHGWIP